MHEKLRTDKSLNPQLKTWLDSTVSVPPKRTWTEAQFWGICQIYPPRGILPKQTHPCQGPGRVRGFVFEIPFFGIGQSDIGACPAV